MFKNIVLKTLKGYKIIISPIVVSFIGAGCRFSPTCSDYAFKAIKKYGVLKGVGLGISRIGRCHPFSSNHFDPVP